MNCPGHFLLYQSQIRSYRDLPIRFADFGVLHRNELAGALTGLTRVRRFQQDDAHIMCTHEQIHSEILSCLDFLGHIYNLFGFKYELFLSTKPDKYLGDDDVWEAAENGLKKALNEFGKPWKENPKDGAFYGPKIDINLFDSLNRPHQCGTIQLDFQAPIRFNLLYKTDSDSIQESASSMSKHSETDTTVKNYFDFPPDEFDPEEFRWEEHEVKHGYKRPVVIHRAILGSIERFFSILIEHIDGKWPFWLSPKQVCVIPVSEKFLEYATKVNLAMQYNGFHSTVDEANLTIKKKVRNAQIAQYNYMLIVGQDEMDLGMVNIRQRDGTIIGLKRVDEVIEMFKKEKPKVSTKEEEVFKGLWRAEDYPVDQAKLEEVLKKMAESEEKKKEEVKEPEEGKQEKKGGKEKKKGGKEKKQAPTPAPEPASEQKSEPEQAQEQAPAQE